MSYLSYKTVRPHDVGNALVVQRATIAIGNDVFSVEFADDRNHRFGFFFPTFPIGEIVF